MSCKTKFNKDWLRPDFFPQFSSWVEEIKGSPYQYRCNACCRVYEMSNMGQQALTSHMTKSDKHKKAIKARNETSSLDKLWKPGMFHSLLLKKNVFPTEKKIEKRFARSIFLILL